MQGRFVEFDLLEQIENPLCHESSHKEGQVTPFEELQVEPYRL